MDAFVLFVTTVLYALLTESFSNRMPRILQCAHAGSNKDAISHFIPASSRGIRGLWIIDKRSKQEKIREHHGDVI